MERWQIELAAGFLAEDVGRGDRTTQAVVRSDAVGSARIEARSSMVVAGLEMAEACFELLGEGAVKFTAESADGTARQPGDVIARLDGDMRPILTAERTALNLLGRLSGIATLTSRYMRAVSATRATVVDTRKTTPGLRRLEKDAVRAGGGRNHRWGLDDGILIKDNHIAVAGSVASALRAAKHDAQHGLAIEVEVGDLREFQEAVDEGADLILLDNMPPEMVAEAALRAPEGVLLEASGGITLDNVAAYAEAGADLISIGALTHSAPACDVSLEVQARWC